jgi:hypothetical protein
MDAGGVSHRLRLMLLVVERCDGGISCIVVKGFAW